MTKHFAKIEIETHSFQGDLDGECEFKICSTTCGFKEHDIIHGYKSLPADWHEDSSLETWFPLTAEELKNKTERILELSEALRIIQTSPGEPCERCCGNGRLWADGQAHGPNYNGLTRSCPQCDGKGVIFPDFKEIATAVLMKGWIV
jgi:hypothetical protein